MRKRIRMAALAVLAAILKSWRSGRRHWVALAVVGACLVVAALVSLFATLALVRPAAPSPQRVHLVTDVVPLRVFLAEQLREEGARHQLDLVLTSKHAIFGSLEALDLNGEYRGTVEVYSATDREAVFRTDYFMRISQSWEQICLLIQRQGEAGGLVRVHSDKASVHVGMLAGVTTLRFLYTFEENLPRREGVGSMARQFSGAATFEFRREGDAWQVAGHFFDDSGRSGQVNLRQGLASSGNPTEPRPPQPAGSREQPQA